MMPVSLGYFVVFDQYKEHLYIDFKRLIQA